MDERYWAACALYAATGGEAYHKYIKISYNPVWAADLGWADVGAYGNAVYLKLDDDRTDAILKNLMKDGLLHTADKLVEVCDGNAYAVSTGKYIWGSNMTVLNNAMLLLMAHDIKPQNVYMDYAVRTA